MTDRELSPESGSGGPSPLSEHHDDQQSPEDSSVKAEQGDENSTGSNQTVQMPVQKRRRVTRACDECRRKKIKCDGKQPCTHCSVYSYECTYDKPSNRRRNPAPQYIEALENKLARAEACLRKFVPDVDLNDPNLDPAVQQEFQNRERQRLHAAKTRQENAKEAEKQTAQIMSMIETLGQLDLTEGGGWDFRGTSSGAVFLRRMKDHFRGLLGYDYQTTFLPRPTQVPGLLKLDSPQSTTASTPNDSRTSNVYDLPPKERARQLSYYTFETEDNRFLGLLYAVMAVGCMYNIAEEDVDNQVNYSEATEEGMGYYTSARILLQDITECRDLTSLQSLLFLILFLQATSNLSACYAFLGIALRTALRMGLHRHLPNANFTPLVSESRRRIFYFIRQLDIYCSALLGFPILLHEEDIDQQLPSEIDDEFITAESILTPPPETPGSFFQAFNAHSRLMEILMKVIKYIYPLKGIEDAVTSSDNESSATYMIEYRRIKEIEGDLQVWHEQLPQRWRPSAEGPIEVMRVRTLLRFAYAHVQMMLYRPFLHYISPRLSAGKVVDESYYACAAAGISVCRNIIHIAMEIKNQALVVGPFWSMLYTQFFAILTLVFYTLENPDKQGSAEIFSEANAGREMIAKMALRSLAADRITKSLDTLWDNLPESVKQGKPRAPVPASRGSDTRTGAPLAFRSPMQGGRSSSRGFSVNAPELHALDVSGTGASDTGGETPSSSHPGESPYIPQHRNSTNQTMNQSPNSLYKFDAMMFTSGDPFAYPNQPLVEAQPQQMPVPPQADSSNFFMAPGLYGGIEGQLTGPLPPYLMQHPAGQAGLDLSTQMYQSPSSLAAQQYHVRQGHHHQQQQPQPHPGVGREMDEMMTEAGFSRNWDMFNGNFKPM
ncbi:fungal specific transcription factor domain-containing protein [Diaporthe amygdali]|uniref:fungal specific transcription factor domain-containing protein n=1 Tax=Phomopsis amygdali TaxID=1214568 RepID=UPI0022FE51BD|nr:fungal specific transcription factor domain-containing protein [Diaporthe amygdali]KAJ0118437.1 fungal specific transcription factor domain-containing protein [Diaporthe amygdali]